MAVVAVVGAYWMLVLSPKREEAVELDSRSPSKQTALATAEADVATYEARPKHYKRELLDGRAARQGRARPTTTCARCWSRSTRPPKHAGVDFRTINIGGLGRAGAPAPAAAPTTDTAPPPGASTVGTAGFSTMPFSFNFKGSFFQLGKFFNRLDKFVAVRNGGLDVTGRLLLLNSITLTPDTAKGFPHLTRRRDREQLPAAAHGGPDRRRDRRGPDRRGCCRRRRDAVAQHPRNHHDRNDLWSHPMSVINDTWRFLVQRRLWPVAILLVAAAVAVPMLLAKDPARRAGRGPAVAVKADKDAVLAEDPIVTQASDGDRSGRRQVLGSRKDPFKPQGHPDSDARSPRPPRPRSPATGATTGAPTGGGRWRRPRRRAPRPRRTPTTPVVPQEEEVRAVRAVGALRRRRPARPRTSDVKRLQALPSNSNPC